MVFVNKVHDVNHVCLGFLIAGHGAGRVFLGVGVFGSFDIDLSFWRVSCFHLIVFKALYYNESEALLELMNLSSLTTCALVGYYTLRY